MLGLTHLLSRPARPAIAYLGIACDAESAHKTELENNCSMCQHIAHTSARGFADPGVVSDGEAGVRQRR